MKRFYWKSMLLILLISTLLPLGSIANASPKATEKNNYYFVYNSSKVDAKDLAAIKQYAAKFKSTNNILFDAKGYTSAVKLYDALKGYQKKIGGSVAGVQIFGVSDDVPAFSYVSKMRMFPPNDKWNGVATDTNQKYVTDFFYSTFKNDSKYLNTDITVYDVLEKGVPLSLMPEWSVARLPLTKGEIAGYVAKYNSYRKQINNKPVPTAVFSIPTEIDKNAAQNDAALFANRLKNEFGLLKNTELRTYTEDLKTNIVKENKSGVTDFLLNSDVNSDLNSEGSKLMSRSTVKSGITANFYTAFFWETKSAKGLGFDNIVHDGLVKGKMINPIAKTTPPSNGGLYNYIWAVVEVKDGQEYYDYVPATLEMLQNNNTYYLLYLYYEALNEGKSRSDSLLEAKIGYITNALKHPSDTGYMFGFESVIAYHYLGLADYE